MEELIITGPFATQDDCFSEIARMLIHEHAQQGWNREQVLEFFRDPEEHEANTIYKARGETKIMALIADRIAEGLPPAQDVRGACGSEPACWSCPNAAPDAAVGKWQRVARHVRGWLGGTSCRNP